MLFILTKLQNCNLLSFSIKGKDSGIYYKKITHSTPQPTPLDF